MKQSEARFLYKLKTSQKSLEKRPSGYIRRDKELRNVVNSIMIELETM